MSEEKARIVKEFLSATKVLIVEPSSSFKQTVISCFTELGASESSVLYAKKYQDAIKLLKQEQPRILITEFFVEDRFGLSLVDAQAQFYDEATRMVVLVTHNSSASAVAQAAEEQVDEYILKPFSPGELKERLLNMIYRKINPSDYVKKIREGKKAIKEKKFEMAKQSFIEARNLEKAPTLAHYYSGFTDHLQNSFGPALEEYKSGLSIQPLHYKCMMGEFDALFDQKRYGDAYLLVDKIRKNYPLSPRRLGNVFISAVFSYNLKDVPAFFGIFQKLDERPPELVKLFSAALLTAGKYYIKNNQAQQAFECFDLGITVTGPVVSYIDSVIRELLKLGAGDKAQVFLGKFPRDEVGGRAHSVLSFLVDRYTLPAYDAIERGKKLVSQGYADPDSFRSLVKLCIANNKLTMAEDIASKAVVTYPELRSEIYSLFPKAR